MILNCAIVDDEPLALELLRSYVEKTSFLRLVGRYSSAVQAMTEIPLRAERNFCHSLHRAGIPPYQPEKRSFFHIASQQFQSQRFVIDNSAIQYHKLLVCMVNIEEYTCPSSLTPFIHS